MIQALRPFRDLDVIERWIVLGVAILHVACIGWGLPASDGWDVDGIAPRDFLPGIVKTFTPGDYFTYPPFHLALLTVLTLPVTLFEVARSPTLAPADLIATFLSVPVMTAFALVARVVNFAMSIGVVLMVGRMASAVFATRRARAWAMAVSGVEVAGTYYAHTTNLDMPALFWACLALLALIRALEHDDPRGLRSVVAFAACAIASKDQAYAVFALSIPIVLVAWILSRASRAERAEVAREGIIAAAIGVGLVLLLDAAIFNPSGFAARVRFLTGPASQDFAQHSADGPGRLSALKDVITFLPNHYPVALAPLLGIGLVFAITNNEGTRRIIALVPLLAMVSFTLAFNCVARRVEERFVMPQMQLAAVYAGGISVLVERLGRVARPLGAAASIGAAGCVLLGLRLAGCVIATMHDDARYDAERFLRERVSPGETIEVYGPNVYLPRFPRGASVQRIGTSAASHRNPMPGIVEKQDRLGAVDERRPRWIVVGTGFAWRYLQEVHGPKDGRVLPEIQRAMLLDSDTTSYVRALFAGQAGYAVAHVSHSSGSALLPPRPLHASLATDVFVFERR
jgi:4-amino-4-deoxy-L-arabinose transferase-like glycosyltransferase